MEWVGDSRMIRLDEVAKKIQSILNGDDPEVIALGLTMPTGFQFVAETEGYHLDSIADMQEGKNFVPVFVSSMGGQFNPVPELLQANYTIPITFYFPVSFKNDMFKMNEYLARVFVGRQLNYGPNSGIALSNISVAQFGEIVDLDLKQFAEWVRTTYKKPIDVFEPYLQMSITLYLSTASNDFVYGNDAEATLTIDDEEVQLDEEPLVFVSGSVQSNTDPSVQQILGEGESEGLASGTAYGSSFSVYVKNDDFFKYLVGQWFSGNAQTLPLTLKLKFLGQTYTRNCYIQSVNTMFQKGELVTMTFAFNKKAVVDNG